MTKNDILNFIRTKVSDANSDGIAVGLSGGIDSTLVAYLACEALGSDKVFGIIMPSTTTPTEDKLHGVEVAQNLKINYKEIAIDSILNEYLALTQITDNDVAIGNLKARIRMSIMYYYANSMNYLVSGTGNKSEILIGYFTKYGDGACDIEPIGDLYKGDVYKLAEYVNIPSQILKKPPRAGLWNNQTDEDEIGLGYDVIDNILYLLTEKNYKFNEISRKLDVPLSDVDMIVDKVIKSRHKSKIPESPRKTIIW